MRYHSEMDLALVIKTGLAVRELERSNKEISSSDFTLSLGEVYKDWTADLIDTILDLVEERQKTADRIRAMRGKRP
jgi:hypothetical protein